MGGPEQFFLKPKKKQKHVELWWRWPAFDGVGDTCWSFTLYICHIDGTLFGYFDQTVIGRKIIPTWNNTFFKRDKILDSDGCFEFICEIEG